MLPPCWWLLVAAANSCLLTGPDARLIVQVRDLPNMWAKSRANASLFSGSARLMQPTDDARMAILPYDRQGGRIEARYAALQGALRVQSRESHPCYGRHRSDCVRSFAFRGIVACVVARAWSSSKLSGLLNSLCPVLVEHEEGAHPPAPHPGSHLRGWHGHLPEW